MEGIKRLEKMLEGQKDKYLNIIVKHLMLQTEMNEAFLNEDKNLKDMAEFIRNQAKKQSTNGVAVIEDAVVFKWAREYFIKSNKELGIKNTKTEKDKHKDITEVEVKEEFGSIFDFDNDTNYVENKNDKKEEVDQISLFAA